MSIRKQYLKTRPICKVTFRIPEDIGQSARSACVIGDFNEWSLEKSPMKRLKSGAFSVTLDLEKGRQYEFRYLLNGVQWENEDEADATSPTPYGDCVNSVIIL